MYLSRRSKSNKATEKENLPAVFSERSPQNPVEAIKFTRTLKLRVFFLGPKIVINTSSFFLFYFSLFHYGYCRNILYNGS